MVAITLAIPKIQLRGCIDTSINKVPNILFKINQEKFYGNRNLRPRLKQFAERNKSKGGQEEKKKN